MNNATAVKRIYAYDEETENELHAVGEKTRPIAILADEVEYLADRRSQIAALSRSLKKPLLVIASSRERAKVVEASLLAWFLKSEGIAVDFMVAGQGSAGLGRHAKQIAARKPVLLVLAGGATNPLWLNDENFLQQFSRKVGAPILFLDSPSDFESNDDSPFDGVVGACDTRRRNIVGEQSARFASAIGCDLKLIEILDSERLAQDNHARRRGVKSMESAVLRSEAALDHRVRDIDSHYGKTEAEVEVRIGDVVRELNIAAQDFENPLVVVRQKVNQPRWPLSAIEAVEGSLVTVSADHLC